MSASADYNRNMSDIHINSVSDPFDTPDLVRLSLSIIVKAEAMGLLDRDLTLVELGWPEMEQVLGSIAGAGLAARHVTAILADPAGENLEASLAAIDGVLEDSPVPDREWRALLGLFDPESLGALVGISASSVRRYADGSRATPDGVGSRLHWIALVVGHLRGVYNEFGIRRWFVRSRTRLEGRAPGDLLRGQWDPDDGDPRRVMALARAAGAGGAT